MRGIVFWGVIASALLFIWRKPYWGVVFYGLLNIVRPEMLFWGSYSYGKAGSYVIIVTAAATLVKAKLDFSSAKTQLILLLWLGIALKTSIFFSEYTIYRSDLYANEIWKILMFCILLAILVKDKEEIETLENFFLGSMIFLGLWAIQQHFLGNERLEGIGNSDSNGFAAFLVLFTPLAYNKFSDKKAKYSKTLGFLSTGVLIITIIFTQSRGGFLGLAAASLMWFKGAKQKGKIIVVAVLLAMTLIPFVSQEYINRLDTMNTKEGDDLEGSARSRLILWQAGLLVFADNPVFGTGFMSYPVAKMKYKSEFDYLPGDFLDEIFRDQNPKVTHSTYIQLLSDGGLFLATPYLLMFIVNILGNYRVRKRYGLQEENQSNILLLNSIEAGIIGYSVSIIFIDTITFVFLPVQILMSAIIRSNIIKNTETDIVKVT